MSFAEIEAGLEAVLKTSAKFEDGNVAFGDLSCLETAPQAWAAVVDVAPSEWSPATFGSPTGKEHTWGLVLTVFIEWEQPKQFNEDKKTILDEVVSVLNKNDTLNDTCDSFTFRLVNFDSVELFGRSWGVYDFSIDAKIF